MAQCKTPGGRKHSELGNIQFPCGTCPNCKMNRATGWSVRLNTESRLHLLSSFATMTYNTDNVPITDKGFMSLSKTDLSSFFKTLRDYEQRKLGRTKHIRYYGVGEYGSQTMRPHYHAIIFGAEPESIIQSWKHGEVHLGKVEGASIGYCLKYISKPGKIPLHQNDDRVPEYSRMSKGIGSNYLSESTLRWHKMALADNFYFPLPGGDKVPLPRYYKQRLYSPEQRGYLKGHYEQTQEARISETVNRDFEGNYEAYIQQMVTYDIHKQEQQKRKASYNNKI